MLMADFFKWASATPAVNLLFVLALGVLVIITIAGALLCIIAFAARIPFKLFGFEVWASGLVHETATSRLVYDSDVYHLEPVPAKF
jgi:hypothetical protein